MAGLNSQASSPLSWIINPWYPLSILALGLQAFFWVQVLKSCTLSIAYPMSSLVFGVNLAFAFIFFDEKITQYNIIGITIIMIGVGLTLKQTR
jgi:uncharacterized membrane protein